jgi:hypothetical protein
MHHPFRDFVHRSVAAGRQNQIGAPVDVFTRDGTSRARPGGRRHRNRVSMICEDFDGFFEQPGPIPSEFTRARVINQDSIPVADCSSPIFLVL